MKRNIRTVSRMLACLLLTVQLLSLFCGVSAQALDDCMIVHYDFEGETPEEQLKDKATAGSVSDDLVTAKNATVSDGVATLAVDGLLKTANAGDVALLEDSITV